MGAYNPHMNPHPPALIAPAADGEAHAKLALRRARALATGLLAAMASLFVLAALFEREIPALSFLRAFAEAAMVGGLADWFAVTALFHRPLGLPIPHTAIIPSNKERIAHSVAGFLEHNFLTAEVLRGEMARIDFAAALSGWLSRPESAAALARQISSAAPALIRMAQDKDAGAFIQKALQGALANVKMAPALGEALSILIAQGRHRALMDHLIGLCAEALKANEAALRQKVREKSPAWMPSFVDQKLHEKLMSAAAEALDDLRRPESAQRQRLEAMASEWVERLKTDPAQEALVRHWLDSLFTHPLFADYAGQVWGDARDRLLADIASPDSKTRSMIERAALWAGSTLAQDPASCAKLNAWASEFATQAISERRAAIASLAQRVISKWDSKTLADKFELYVGRDLQYIRLNGTLVGGLVGLILHAAFRLLQ